MVGYVEDLRNLLMHSSLAERKAFIKSFVREVKVSGDEVLLSYTIPLPPQGITEDEDKVGVLSIVQNSSPSCSISRTFRAEF